MLCHLVVFKIMNSSIIRSASGIAKNFPHLARTSKAIQQAQETILQNASIAVSAEKPCRSFLTASEPLFKAVRETNAGKITPPTIGADLNPVEMTMLNESLTVGNIMSAGRRVATGRK